MAHVLSLLLTSRVDLRPIASAAEWEARFAEAARGVDAPADRALVAGLAADRVAYAFAGGYQAALAQLTKGKLDPARAGRVTSLCITEEGGGHPRAVKTALAPLGGGRLSLSGRKQWATGAPLADRLLVAASTGLDEAGKNRLRLVSVDARAKGVTLEKMPDPPFAPELPHAIVKLDGVEVREDDLLPGDGYDAYVKPFRTIEDAHVFLALVGHIVRAARAYGGAGGARGARGARDVIELAAAAALALREVASAMDPSAPETHVALAGALDLGRRLMAEAEAVWSAAPEDVRARWERDRALSGVAERARSERRARAWERLAGGPAT
jgi:alkylation response protein AidB-like acyl-CoA dehydrogenase